MFVLLVETPAIRETRHYELKISAFKHQITISGRERAHYAGMAAWNADGRKEKNENGSFIHVY